MQKGFVENSSHALLVQTRKVKGETVDMHPTPQNYSFETCYATEPVWV